MRPADAIAPALAAGLLLALAVPAAGEGKRVEKADRIDQLSDVIGVCWQPEALPPPGQTWQITARVAFTMDGRLLGPPFVTFAAVPNEAVRKRLRESLIEAFQRCAPLPFTVGLGKAIAGRPVSIRFILTPRPGTGSSV